ncbi:hypothetical protein ES703_110460 [subsurface metagenome]
MEETEKEPNVNTLPQRVMGISGAIASIIIITMIMYFFRIIPSTISIAMGFFVSLPIAYSFVFGIIFNKPNFSTLRHYGFLFYILFALIIYMLVLKPDSIALGAKYLLHFFLGFVLAVVGYSCYALGYRIMKKHKYRWRALVGFGVSLIITFIVAFILKHFKIFEII